jgi:hypothetical protein
MTMLLSLSKKCRKCGEQCLDPELLLVARGSAWGRELLLGLGDVVARTCSARNAVLELIRVAVLGAGTAQREVLRTPHSRLDSLMLLDSIGEEAAAGGVVGAMITAWKWPREGLAIMRMATAR